MEHANKYIKKHTLHTHHTYTHNHTHYTHTHYTYTHKPLKHTHTHTHHTHTSHTHTHKPHTLTHIHTQTHFIIVNILLFELVCLSILLTTNLIIVSSVELKDKN